MLLTERFTTETDAGQDAPRPVALRLFGGTPDEQLIPLAAGKQSVGSGPRCSVRLQNPGVRPLHCLIVHNAEGVRVRRWADDTLLNGVAFDEAPLLAGDLLSVGSIELEALASTPTADAELPAASPQDWVTAEPELRDPGEPRPAAEKVDRLREANAAARRRSRKLLAALRSNRDEFAELVQRIDSLEQKVDAALGEREGHAEEQHDAEPVVENFQDSESPCAGWDRLGGESAAIFSHEVDEAQQAGGAPDWAAATQSPAASEAAPWAGQWSEPAAGSAELPPSDPALIAELTATQQQLSEFQQRSADAEITIDALAQQLAELHQERQQLAEERADWLRQMTELEARLAEYAKRVPELEAQLQQLCESGGAAARDRHSSPRQTSAGQTSASPRPADAAEQHDWPAHAGADPTSGYDWSTHRAPSTHVAAELADAAAAAVDDEFAVEAAEAAGRDVPTPPANPDRESNEIESTVAQLRGLSLWREEAGDATAPAAEPEIASESTPAVEPPRADESADAPQAAGVQANESAAARDNRNASFIDRYAHLFEDEEAGQPSPSLSPPSPTADRGSLADSVAAVAARPSSVEPAAVGNDDEESIERYMAKMMQRLRGDSTSPPASQAPPPAPAAKLTMPQATTRAGTSASVSDAGAAEDTPPTAESMYVHRPRPTSGPAPERGTDMAALRALANQTARHAIGVHAAGKSRRHAVTRFIIALLAGTASLYFFLSARSWESLEFATASVCLLASFYWGRLTLGSLVKAVRAGAFDDYDTQFAAVGGVSEQLPIDVER